MASPKFITHQLQGVEISQRFSDGYLNATALSKAYLAKAGKRREPNDWLRQVRTQETIKHLSETTGIPIADLVFTREGRKGGTFIHPDLAPALIAWIEGGKSKRPSDAVYLIQADGTSIFKIGIAIDPDDRLANMQVGSPLKLSMVRVVYRSDAQDVERRLHEQLDEYRTHGEWFSLPAPDVIALFVKETGAADTLVWEWVGRKVTGHDPVVRRGMFSATQVERLHRAKGGKRTIAEWVKDEATTHHVNELVQRYGTTATDLITEASPDVYIHPRLYPWLLCWIDDDFGLAIEDAVIEVRRDVGRGPI